MKHETSNERIKEFLERLLLRQDVSREYPGLLAALVDSETTDAQIAAVLIALKLKGESVDELVGLASSMRARAQRIQTHHKRFIDTAGTGSSRAKTFNVSTAAAFVIAGAGLPVAKHGNRAASSKCGSADVLTALGVNVSAPPEISERCLNEIGICFMFAPVYHPSMARVAAVRRELGVQTVFNLVGPLANPAGASLQLIGVSNRDWLEPLAAALGRLGIEHGWVVHGEDGLDEITISGKTFVAEAFLGGVRTFEISPEDFGLEPVKLKGIRCGNAKKNAAIISEILNGSRRDGARQLVLVNVAAALFIGTGIPELKECMRLAEDSIDSGRAAQKLEQLISITNGGVAEIDLLSDIIAVKKQRVAAAKAACSLDEIRERARQKRLRSHPHAFAEAFRGGGINLIAEFKRRSPSKGKFNTPFGSKAQAQIYESAGAAAVSVLTEEDYFDGSLEDLRGIRQVVRIPILRKDFIFDEYQVYESAAAGADALLLIVAALDDQRLKRLREVTENELGMDALVEVHNQNELQRAVTSGARLIGVNNRDLRTFEVSVVTSHLVAREAPKETILISESGLSPSDVRGLRSVGYSGFLVGETLLRAPDPAKAIRHFIGEPELLKPQSVLVKICGITNVEDAYAAIEAGANMLGFNFCRASPRFIPPDAAREIIAALRAETRSESPRVGMVGVFVNEAVENVIKITERSGLDGIQLHGDETIEYCRELEQRGPKRFVLKVVRSNGAVDFPNLTLYPVHGFMLDAYDAKLRGGTGQTADWTVAREAARRLPRVFLAGGLSPENVADAITTVRPYAVDACSSLELSPGKKDHARMKEFVAAVRAVKLPDEVSASQ